MRIIFLYTITLLSTLFCSPPLFAANTHIGVIRVPEAKEPGLYYTLTRADGRVVPKEELLQDMKVYNGDIIQPKPDMQPPATLIYVSRACGRVVLLFLKELKIECAAAPAPGKAERFFSFLVDIPKSFFRQKISRRKTTLSRTMTTRGEEEECFPPAFDHAYWPPDGSTLLAGNRSIFFRQEAPGFECLPGRLRIREAGKKEPVFETACQAGALAETAVRLKPDTTYLWEVEAEDNGMRFLGDEHRFRVLSTERSRAIQEDLRALAFLFNGDELHQARIEYLRYLGEHDDTLDLAAEADLLERRFQESAEKSVNGE